MAEIPAKPRLDEDEIKIGLLGTHEEHGTAIETLYQHYHSRVMRFIVKHFPGLPYDFAASAMLETFIALSTAARRESFDFEKSLEAFLFKTARFKAIDEYRKVRRSTSSNDELYEGVGKALTGTEVSELWRKTQEAGKVLALRSDFLDFLQTLPPRQRQVAQVMADKFPRKLTEAEICDEIFVRMGDRPTVIEAKSALAQIRMKFRSLLKKES